MEHHPGQELATAERRCRRAACLSAAAARLPVWFAVGTHLARTRGYQVAMLQNGAMWSSDFEPGRYPASTAPPSAPPFPAGRWRCLSHCRRTRATTRRGTSRCTGRPPGTCGSPCRPGSARTITGAVHAWATALALRDEARRIAAVARPSVVHLFLAVPAGLALLLGHVWDRVPDTQTYEDLAANGYQPAFFIPN